MKIGKRGIAQALILLYIVIAVIGGAVFWKPVTSLLPFGNNIAKQQKDYHKKTETKPILYYKDEKGEHVANWTKEEESTKYFQQEDKPSLLQRLLGLGVFGIVLCVAFPAFGIWVARKAFIFYGNFKQLVTGIEEAKKELSPDAIKTLETNLSKKTNLDTKALVKKIKVKL